MKSEKAQDPAAAGRARFERWREELRANPEYQAIYEEEAAKKELWLQLVEARMSAGLTQQELTNSRSIWSVRPASCCFGHRPIHLPTTEGRGAIRDPRRLTSQDARHCSGSAYLRSGQHERVSTHHPGLPRSIARLDHHELPSYKLDGTPAEV